MNTAPTVWNFQQVAGLLVPLWTATLFLLVVLVRHAVNAIVDAIKAGPKPASIALQQDDGESIAARVLFEELVHRNVEDSSQEQILRRAVELLEKQVSKTAIVTVRSVKVGYYPDPTRLVALRLPCFYNSTFVAHMEVKDPAAREPLTYTTSYNLVVDVKHELAQFVIVY